MTTIVRRRKLGLTSVKGIIAASKSAVLRYANNYEGIPEDDIYIRWGCTSDLPNKDARVINSAKGIHRVADKAGFRALLDKESLCPRTWFTRWDIEDGRFDYPLIVRTRTHAQGRGMWVCNDWDELVKATEQAGEGHYINEFVDKVAEYRVFVHQGRVVWVAKKTPGNPDDVAWNVSKGGRFDNVRWSNWPLTVVNAALIAWDLSKLHFAGIDVMEDEMGNAYVLEANSAPSQTSPYRQECVARAFDWMQAHNNYERKPFDEVIAYNWKDAIHPGVRR